MLTKPIIGRLISIVIIVIFILNSLVIISPNKNILASASSIPPTINGDWTVSNSIRYDGGTCVLSGNITIQSGGSLILNNLTLALNNPDPHGMSPAGRWIIVNSGGILRIFNSTIKTNTIYQSWDIVNQGSLQIENSTVRDFYIAIDVLNQSTIIKNSYIINNTYGIMLDRSFTTIINDTISNNTIGLLLAGRPNIFRDNVFSYNDYGITDDTNGIMARTYFIGNCTFKNNRKAGLDIEYSQTTIKLDHIIVQNNGPSSTAPGLLFNKFLTVATITNSLITNNKGNGITFSGSSIYIINSTIRNNSGKGIELGNAVGYFYNSTVIGNQGDIFLWGGNANYPVLLYNTTYSALNLSQNNANGKIEVFWYVNISATWQLDNLPVGGGEYTIFDKNGNLTSKGTLDSNGHVMLLPTLQFILRCPNKSLNWTNSTPYQFNLNGTRGSISRTNRIGPMPVTKSINVGITLDDRPPSLKILNPKEGYITNKTNILVLGKSEPGATIWLGTSQFVVNNFGDFTASATLANEGINNINLKAVDAAGNEQYAQVNVTRDMIAPILTIVSPKDGDIFNHTTVEVKGITEKGAILMINGFTEPISNDGKFDVNITFNEGNDTITVTSTDIVGNIAIKSVRIRIDLTPPILDIISPKNGFKTKEASMMVKGTTEAGAQVTINGIGITFSGTTFQSSVVLVTGMNTIVVKACDIVKNCRIRTVNGSFSTRIPALNITSPPTESEVVTNKSTFNIIGKTEYGDTLLINYDTVTFSYDGSFSYIVALFEGTNLFTIISTDEYGNKATVTRDIRLDTTPPILVVSDPKTGLRTNARSVQFSGTTEEGVNITINGNPVQFSGSSFITTVQLTKEGINNFIVKATDEAGNSKIIIINITRKTILNLRITSPTNGTTTKNDNVTVQGTTDPNINVVINGQQITSSKTGGFSMVVALTIGGNDINVRATDDIGNSDNVTLYIVHERVVPNPYKRNGSGYGLNLLEIIAIIIIIALIIGIVLYLKKFKKKINTS